METIGRGPREKENKRQKGTRLHFLYGFLLGVLSALILGLLLRVGPFFSILAGIGGFIAGTLIFRSVKGKKEQFDFSHIDGITKETHESALKEGNAKLSQLRIYSDRIQDRDIQVKAKNICILTEKILDSIKKDPKDLKPARSFLHYYLDTAMNILKQYNDIAIQRIRSKDVEEVIHKVDRTLGTLEQAFEKQLARLMENDVLNLDTELTVLEKTIEMEGFGKDLKR